MRRHKKTEDSKLSDYNSKSNSKYEEKTKSRKFSRFLGYENFRNFFRKRDPESAHNFAVYLSRVVKNFPGARSWIRKNYTVLDDRLKSNVMGLDFRNPVGLGAGFDKHIRFVPFCYDFGFGFTEIGTITQLKQDGKPRPRIWRHQKYKALTNAMGFPNMGADNAARALKRVGKSEVPLGINFGKSLATILDDASSDYLYTLQKLEKYGDYFVINVSSPNTPELRELQSPERLIPLLNALQGVTDKPMLLKIAPDLKKEDLHEILDIAYEANISGIIATNTTIDRSQVGPEVPSVGGLSGPPLRELATKFVHDIYAYNKKNEKDLPIIGVGGVSSAEDAYEMIRQGASLVQVFTALTYEGPGLIKSINEGLIELLKRDGFTLLKQAVGVAHE